MKWEVIPYNIPNEKLPKIRILRVIKFGDGLYWVYLEFKDLKRFSIHYMTGTDDNGVDTVEFIIWPKDDIDDNNYMFTIKLTPETEEEREDFRSVLVFTQWFRYGFNAIIVNFETHLQILEKEPIIDFISD